MANFAQLGIEIESKDAVTAASNLDSMAAAGKRAEKVTDDLKKSTTDWSAEQAKANARAAEMASQEARREASLKKANSAIRDQQQELAKLLGSIDPAVAALGRLDEQERKLAQFRKQGAIDGDTFAQYNKRLQDQRNILGGVADAQGKAGMSTRAYSAAMRNVPAQITDITTSLISGQPAYLVAIQQGGQLKDMFGGIGPAAKALTTSLIGMINPVTLLSVGVGALALAWKQSADDAFEFNKALILTGNYADKTDEQLSRMASRLDTLGGVTAGTARSALLAVANTGKFTGEQFDLVATAAARMEGSIGVSVDQTVAKFVEIGKAPVDALVKLNDAEHFLTQAQLERVQALVAEGREQEAVAVATKLYADNIDLVASRAEAALPTISRWWRGVKDETSGAWNELKIYMNLVAEAIELRTKFFSGGSESGFVSNFASSFLPSNRLRALNSAMRDRNSSVRGADFSDVTGRVLEPMAQSSQQLAAQEAWKQTLATTDKVLARKIAIEEIERKGIAAGASRAEIDKQIAAYNQQQLASATKSESIGRTRIPQLTEEQKAAQALAKSYESITSQLERQLALSGDRSQLGRINYEISSGSLQGLGVDEQAKLRNLAITQDAVDDFAAIYGDGVSKVVAETQSGTDMMTEFSVQAARNMQSSFADFLFDPFENGVGGMAKSFAKTLQRMAAEAAAAQIFKSIGNWASGYSGTGAGWINAIGGLISNGKADGGYTGPGGKYDPRGIVHAGEVVWSQRDVAAVGGPRAANAMRPTAGYATGGIVGGLTRAVRNFDSDNSSSSNNNRRSEQTQNVTNNFNFKAPTSNKTQSQIAAKVGYEISRANRLRTA